MLAVFLVVRIEDVVEAGIPDQFLGLIMLPLVEKAAEHLTAVDEAWDGQIVGFLSSHTFKPLNILFVRQGRGNNSWKPLSFSEPPHGGCSFFLTIKGALIDSTNDS